MLRCYVLSRIRSWLSASRGEIFVTDVLGYPSPPVIARSRALTAALVFAVAAGIGLRAWALGSFLGTPDADEAVWTLMSRHVLHGEFPVYFWGQGYGGTIEVYLGAPFVWALGGGVTAVRVLLLLLGTVVALLVYVVGRRVVEPWQAIVAVALYWVWPAYSAFKATRVHGFYLSGQILALLVVLLVLRLAERPKRLDAFLLGGVLGLAAWQTLQVLPIVLPALAWLAWRRPSAYKLAWLAVPGLVLGSLPALIFNVRNHLWFSSDAPGGGRYPSHLHGFLTAVLPEQLGLRVPFTLKWLVPLPISLLLVAAIAVALVYLLVRHRRDPIALLAVVALAYPFIYAASAYTWYVDEPRYLFVAAPLLALLAVVPLRRPPIAAAALVAIVALSVGGMRSMSTSLDHNDSWILRDTGPLVGQLESRGITRAVSEYWLEYPVILDSNERIILANPSDERYPPYHDAIIAAGPNIPHVYVTGSPDEQRARAHLVKRGYVAEHIGRFTIWQLTRHE